MTDELDRLGAAAAGSVHRFVARDADPDADLAAVYAGGGYVAGPDERLARRGPPWWFLGAAAAGLVAVAVGAIVFVNGRDGGRLTPASSPTSTTSPVTTSTTPASIAATTVVTTTAPVAPGPGPSPTGVPPTAPPATSAPTTTAASTTTGAPPEPATSAPVPGWSVSDDVLPDPDELTAGGDAVAVRSGDAGRWELVVGGSAGRVVPLDVPDATLSLLGVGPQDVAYLAADDNADVTRFLAVPLDGANAGSVYELASGLEQGPWLGLLARNGVDTVMNGVLAYVGADGQPIGDDPTRSWVLDYRDDGAPGAMVQPFLTESASGRTADVPSRRRAWRASSAGICARCPTAGSSSARSGPPPAASSRRWCGRSTRPPAPGPNTPADSGCGSDSGRQASGAKRAIAAAAL